MQDVRQTPFQQNCSVASDQRERQETKLSRQDGAEGAPAPDGESKIKRVQVSNFNFHLPEELIAQKPLEDRAGARMLALNRQTGEYEDHHFREFPEMLREGDVLVLNNSRVIPARLFAHRAGLHTQEGHKTSGRIQVLLTEQISDWEWKVLARPGRKVLTGEKLSFGDNILHAEVIAHGEFGERTICFEPVADF